MYQRVADWNKNCCKTPKVFNSDEYWTSLEYQLSRVEEELHETRLAIENRDLNEVLDGGIDMDVTVAGFNYLAGFNYPEESEKVLRNNDLKYTKFEYHIYDTLEVNEWSLDDYEIKVSPERLLSIHRKSDDKIMKLLNHPKVKLDAGELNGE